MDHHLSNGNHMMIKKLEIKVSKSTDIHIPPINYEKGRKTYKIALPTNLKPNPQDRDSKYRWKEAEAKSIRNSDMFHILDGSIKLMPTTKVSQKQLTPIVDVVLPKIIHGRGRQSMERIKNEEALRKMFEKDRSAENVYGPRELDWLANPPNSTQSVLSGIKKRHRHKHRNESRSCRHRKKEEKERIEEIPAQSSEVIEENANSLWTYTNLNSNNEPDLDEDDIAIMEEESDPIAQMLPDETTEIGSPSIKIPEHANKEAAPQSEEAINATPNSANSKENLDEEVKKAESQILLAPKEETFPKEGTANELENNETTGLKKEVLPPIPKTTSDASFSEQPANIQTSNSVVKTPQKVIIKDIKAILPKNIHLPMFRWKYAIESVFRQLRVKKLPSVHTQLFDYTQILPEDEMNKYKRSHIDRLEKAIDIMKKIPDLKQKHLDLAILKFEETFRKSFPWFQTLKGAVRSHIAQFSRLEYHPAGRPIIKEGGTTRTIYMLAFGLCVEHQQFQSDGQKRDQAIGLVRPGACIGETIGNAIPRRISSVTTLARSLFVCIEKDDWMKAMKKGDDGASKIEGIASLPLFQKLPLKQIQALSAVCSETSAIPETIVLEPFHEPINLFFIKKGKCTLTLHVPFVKTVKDTVKHLISPSEYQVIPFHGQPLKPGKDELVHTTFPMAELGPGDCFPPAYLRDVRGTYKSYTVTAVEATELLIFHMPIVHTMFPPEVASGIKAQQNDIYYDDSQARKVQEHYLSTKGWRNDNDSVIAQLLSREVDMERDDRVANRFMKRNIFEQKPSD